MEIAALWMLVMLLSQRDLPRDHITARMLSITVIGFAVVAAMRASGDAALILAGILSAHGIAIACALVTNHRDTART